MIPHPDLNDHPEDTFPEEEPRGVKRAEDQESDDE